MPGITIGASGARQPVNINSQLKVRRKCQSIHSIKLSRHFGLLRGVVRRGPTGYRYKYGFWQEDGYYA